MVGKHIRVTSDASVLALTCNNVTRVDAALTAGFIVGVLGTVYTVVSCLHIFLKVVVWDGAYRGLGPNISLVAHIAWAIAGSFMIFLAVKALLNLVPTAHHVFRAVLSGRGDELNVDATGWKLTCFKQGHGNLHVAGHWWPPYRQQYSGATSSLKGALVLPAHRLKESCLVVVSHATPFEFCQGMPREDLQEASDAINSFLMQLGLSATPPKPPVCSSEAADALFNACDNFETFIQDSGGLSDLLKVLKDVNDVVARPSYDGSSLETHIVPYLGRSNLMVSQTSTAKPEQLLTGLPSVDVLAVVRPPLWFVAYPVGMLSVLLGGYAYSGRSTYDLGTDSGLWGIVMAAVSVLGAFLAFTLSVQRVLVVDNEEWCLWRAVSWLPVRWTANPRRGDTCEIIGAMVSANVSVYDASDSSYHTRHMREQTRLFTVPVTHEADPHEPLGSITQLIPHHPAFYATPTLLLKRRVNATEESIVCLNPNDELFDGQDVVYAAFRINAHLASLRNQELLS